jgi:hypothetical protein
MTLRAIYTEFVEFKDGVTECDGKRTACGADCQGARVGNDLELAHKPW